MGNMCKCTNILCPAPVSALSEIQVKIKFYSIVNVSKGVISESKGRIPYYQSILERNFKQHFPLKYVIGFTNIHIEGRSSHTFAFIRPTL